MRFYGVFLAVFITLIYSAPAVAVNGVTVIESTGYLYIDVYSSASPTPGWCQWIQLAEDGPLFDASVCDIVSVSGELCCTWQWSARCDSDGLSFQGSLPEFPGFTWYYSGYNVDITYVVELSEAKLLSAHHELAAGPLDPSIHSLSVTYPDSTVIELFSALSETEDIEIELEPATYTIRLVIEAIQNEVTGGESNPYDELFTLSWKDTSPLSGDQRLWGNVKSLYR